MMTKKLVALCLVVLMTGPPMTGAQQAAGRQAPGQPKGRIAGIARTADLRPIGSRRIQLRHADRGVIVQITASTAAGEFVFTNLRPGYYIAELVDPYGRIVGAQPVFLPVDASVEGIIITAISDDDVGAGAAGLVGAAADRDRRGGIGGLFTSTAGLILLAAASAGITAGVVKSGDCPQPCPQPCPCPDPCSPIK